MNQDELYDIAADSDQSENLAAQYPAVAGRLRAAYEDWWAHLSPAFDGVVRIGIGADAEKPTNLNPHDWHVTEQSQSIWNQGQIIRGVTGNGYWAVNIERAGTYEFELRRWPRHLDQSLESVEASIKVGEQTMEQVVFSDQTAAVFTMALEAGPTTVQTWLRSSDDQVRGAYFVYVERME